MTIKRRYYLLELSILISLTFLVLPIMTTAKDNIDDNNLSLRIFNDSLVVDHELSLFEDNFGGVLDMALVDLGGDQTDEIAVAFGHQARPKIKLFRVDGSVINEWAPYAVGYEGKISVAAGDIDGDGNGEIVTGPGEGGGPHIRIFDGFGAVLFDGGFFADDQGNRRGTEVAVGDLDGDGVDDIAVSLLSDDGYVIKFFKPNGLELYKEIVLVEAEVFEPLKISLYDITGDGRAEVILGASIGEKPEVKVYNVYGEKLLSFMAYAETFIGGLDVTVGNVNGKQAIVTGAGYGGGPHIRFFNFQGQVIINPTFFAYENGFRGGLNVALGSFSKNERVVVLPQTTSIINGAMYFGKHIVVDLSEQRLYAYNRGRLEKSFLISSGTRIFPTPVGDFSIWKKRPIVRMSWYYGPGNPNNYDLPGVKWTMSFLGPYNIHGTYWHRNFGHPMSHGCVNLSNANAEWLYNWSPIGTPVRVQR